MTGFFIPGIDDDARLLESAYEGLRRQVERDLGHLPTPRRISSLWTRREGVDCVTSVGVRDPVRDGTVTAIFDMGRHQPFVVCWQHDVDRQAQGCDVLGSSAYTVSEFDA